MTVAEVFYVSLGRKIQDFRRARHLTQQQLGSRLQPPVTRASIANIERGKQGVLAYTLVQIARELEVQPEQLLPFEPTVTAASQVEQVKSELARKLSVPVEASNRLTDRLLPASDRARRKA